MAQFFLAPGKFEDRFDMARFLEYATDNHDPLNSRFLDRLLRLPVRGRVRVEGEEARPDQLSARIYGDTQYWWVILFYNGRQDTDSFLEGQDVLFPSLQELEAILFSLRAKAN